MNGFGAVIVIYFQYEYFRIGDIDIKIYKLYTKMINVIHINFLPLWLESEDFISKCLPIMNIYKWRAYIGSMIILQYKPDWKHSNWSAVNS